MKHLSVWPLLFLTFAACRAAPAPDPERTPSEGLSSGSTDSSGTSVSHTGEPGDTGSTGSAGDTGNGSETTPPPHCGRVDLLEAPDPIDVPGGPIAAVDLVRVEATVRVLPDGLDVEAEAVFFTDEAVARSVFELRPHAAEVLLDGLPIVLEPLTVSDPPREVMSLGVLAPCSEHSLVVRYALPADWMAEEDGPVRFEARPEGVFWAAGMTDAVPGQLLSLWVPSNLLFDRFDLDLTVETSALAQPHELLATGERVELAGGWQVQWTGIQAHSPFWALSPTALTEQRSGVVSLPDGDVAIEVRTLTTDADADADEALQRAITAVTNFSETFGRYPHEGPFVLWVRDDGGHSMEYDGATLTQMQVIEHEVLHSWFGRGVSPIADLHGWVDEAFTSWATDFFPYRTAPIELSTDPRELQVGTDEWAGAYVGLEHYFHGSALPAHLADRHGVEALTEALGAFVVDRSGRPYRSEDLEEHLTCWFDDDGVREAFRHTGYGLTGPAGPRPVGWCL